MVTTVFFVLFSFGTVKVTLNREIITRYLRSEIDLESVSPRVGSRLGGVLEFGEEEREKVDGMLLFLFLVANVLIDMVF